jgi:hypothetical protein
VRYLHLVNTEVLASSLRAALSPLGLSRERQAKPSATQLGGMIGGAMLCRRAELGSKWIAKDARLGLVTSEQPGRGHLNAPTN